MEKLLYGVVGQLPTPWWYVIIGLISVMGTILSVTLYLHRSQAHGAVVFHPIVTHLMRFWLWFTTGMRTKEWVAIHRKHHAFTDKIGDPHTPLGKKPLGVLFLVHDYVRATKDPTIMARYGHGTPDDWIERHLYYPYPLLGVSLGVATAIALFGIVPGTILALAHAAWIPFWAACVINGLGHLIGYRNYDTPDNSRNTVPFFFLAVWIGGEELHNNHHAYPSSAKFSTRWFEFDIGWGVIRLLSVLGLAKVKYRAPMLHIDPAKNRCDGVTLETIQRLRYEVLRRFDRIVDPETAKSEQIAVLMRVWRTQLIEFWTNRTKSQEELIQLLVEWHQKTVRSKIPALQEFARQLPTFTLRRV